MHPKGKGENIWDHFTHHHPERIKDHATGDLSVDSYHRYKEDIHLLSFLGVHIYRFSISWARILPTGFTNIINEKGIRYYSNIIDDLIRHKIEPIVTIYHWDLPQSLQNLGGWTNPLLPNIFVDYANILFQRFGDRVKTWITFNEPNIICSFGYGNTKMAPGINSSGIGDYLCGYTVLKAHGQVYRLYQDKYKHMYKGKCNNTYCTVSFILSFLCLFHFFIISL